MPACLGNIATPHVPLLKKCHTGWYTAPRAWPGQRSGEAGPARAEAGKTNSCTSTWMQEAKTLNCQPCSPEPPQHWHGAFSLHILLEALRSLTDNISEILCSIFLPKWEGSHLWGGFSAHTSSLQWAQLSCMQSLSSPAALLPCLATQISWGMLSLLCWAQVIFPWQLLHLPHYYTEHLQKHFNSKPNYFYQRQYDGLECFALSSNPKRMTNHWLRHISLRYCPQMLN